MGDASLCKRSETEPTFQTCNLRSYEISIPAVISLQYSLWHAGELVASSDSSRHLIRSDAGIGDVN